MTIRDSAVVRAAAVLVVGPSGFGNILSGSAWQNERRIHEAQVESEAFQPARPGSAEPQHGFDLEKFPNRRYRLK